MHFHQDTAKAPHVDRQIIRQAEKYFRRPIEAALNVLVNLPVHTHNTSSSVGEARNCVKLFYTDLNELGTGVIYKHSQFFHLLLAL